MTRHHDDEKTDKTTKTTTLGLDRSEAYTATFNDERSDSDYHS